MASVTIEKLSRQIHAGQQRLVIAVTGGGSGALSGLLSVPGASRTILSATVPYSRPALDEWLGGTPDESCSPATARAMAMSAFLKARRYDPTARVCGVSCTASLASDRLKRGTHRAHLAYQTADTTATASLELDKGRRTRGEEEVIVTALVLNHVAQAAGVEDRIAVPLTEREQLQTNKIVAPVDQQDLLAGRVRAISLGEQKKTEVPRAIFPGAFHPLHQAHRRMAQMAVEVLGCDVAYEISIDNVDKPPLDFLEIDRRAGQFAAVERLWLTRAASFAEKAALFPGATFVVGADTILRVGDTRYYGGQVSVRDLAIDEIASQSCRFLVFGRVIDGEFCSLANLEIPPALAALCQEVPAHHFRDDISSTALREQQLPD